MSILQQFAARPNFLTRKPRRGPAEGRRSLLRAILGGGLAATTASRTMAAPAAEGVSAERARAIDRAEAAAGYLLATVARRWEIQEVNNDILENLDGKKDRARVWALESEIGEAIDEENEAEEAMIEAIRLASADGDDPDRVHWFMSKDGTKFVALPDGFEVDLDRLGEHGLTRLVVSAPGRPAGIGREAMAAHDGW